MRNYGMALTLAAASLGIGALCEPGYGNRVRRYTSLEEEEERFVRRCMDRVARKRRMSEREFEQALARKHAAEARAIEEARPKSRQELRAAARKAQKRLREDRCYQKGERRR